jgi:hypothetical protein
MAAEADTSAFRVEKRRAEGILTLSNGKSTAGYFFVAGGSARHTGPERVGDLLNAELGFFPFEIYGPDGHDTVLFHRDHVVMVALAENEARRDAGYGVATERIASLLLSSGQRIVGAIRVYWPEGRTRLSDWAQHGERFRYIETAETTVLVNVDHVLEIREVIQR